MIRIDHTLVSPTLASMFHLDAPTGIRALAVLAGGMVGKIFMEITSIPHERTITFVRLVERKKAIEKE